MFPAGYCGTCQPGGDGKCSREANALSYIIVLYLVQVFLWLFVLLVGGIEISHFL
jgi:hypothetical protein